MNKDDADQPLEALAHLSLARRIETTINVHLIHPSGRAVDSLIDFLEATYPGLKDSRPEEQSLVQSFDAFAPIEDFEQVTLILRVQEAIERRWSINLDTATLLRMRQDRTSVGSCAVLAH